MKKLSQCLVVLTLVGVLLVGYAVAGATSRNVVVKRVTVQVDGVLDESAWKSAVWYDLNEDTAYAENGKFGDYSGAFALAYDADFIYFAYKAKDSKLIGTRTGENIWQDDCIEAWFSWKDARQESQPGYYQVGLAPLTSSGEPGTWVWRAAPGADTKALEGIEVAAVTTDEGWILEASMARAAFDIPAVLPINATFNLSVVNRDAEGSGGDANWNHLTWNGTVHSDANQFVRLQFQ